MAKYHRWGEKVRPKFPYVVNLKNIFQGWRDNRVMSAMAALRCPKCKKIFFIVNYECQKKFSCPRGCDSDVEFVRDKDALLVSILRYLVSMDPEEDDE